MSELRKRIVALGLAASGLLVAAQVNAGAPGGCVYECTDPVQVSEPGMLYLFALALAGAAIVRRLRK